MREQANRKFRDQIFKAPIGVFFSHSSEKGKCGAHAAIFSFIKTNIIFGSGDIKYQDLHRNQCNCMENTYIAEIADKASPSVPFLCGIFF